ncbi:hypothetical protein M231_01894 [Tremella mesenterica]|uniref:C2H2-type domain-containing protein n=1 Tax=Tremella mesenterica TaxID=5217 RepID=A0A4Q1BS57_TREME|nr:hypothetical protein M231_01894 [Tremella mesenterica]
MHQSDPTPVGPPVGIGPVVHNPVHSQPQAGPYPSPTFFKQQVDHGIQYPYPVPTPSPSGAYRSYDNEGKISPVHSIQRPSLQPQQSHGGVMMHHLSPVPPSPSVGAGSSASFPPTGYHTTPSTYAPSTSSYPSYRSLPTYPIGPTSQSPRPGPYSIPNYYTNEVSGIQHSAEMPRSLSYPSNYSQPYGYHSSMSTPSLSNAFSLPPLARHNTLSHLGPGISDMDMNRGSGGGYSFHSRLPLVERPYKCDECVQSFNRNHDLKRHKRIHLAVKPFGCDKCGKTFSRKDALRRHWLVKGCRGDEGATAPINPIYPMSNPPAASSPSPPNHEPFTSSALSFSHPSAPPSLNTLPSRQASDQSQILVTPSDVNSHRDLLTPMDDPVVIISGSGRESESSELGTGYFDGVVGLKNDGTALMERSSSGTITQKNPPYSRSNRHHPYRRPSQQQGSSPNKRQSPTSLGPDGKPVFAIPFSPAQQNQYDGMIVNQGQGQAQGDGAQMERQGSGGTEGDHTTWQRW